MPQSQSQSQSTSNQPHTINLVSDRGTTEAIPTTDVIAAVTTAAVSPTPTAIALPIHDPAAGKKKSKSKDLGFTHMFAGSVAGMAAKTILQPLDLVKVRLQVQDGSSKNEYRGIVHAIQCILRQEGFFGLYRGLTPNLMASGVSWGVYFFSYNQFKDAFKRRQAIIQSLPPGSHVQLGPVTHLFCAAISGMLATTITNPISMVKTRLQLQGKEVQTASRMYSGVFDAFTRIVREEGFLSLYRGLGPSLVLVSNGALQFMCYEELKKFFSARVGGEQNLSPAHYFFMGGLAKIISATSTYPFAVTRARLFARAPDAVIVETAAVIGGAGTITAEAIQSVPKHKYTNMREVLSATWHREGWRGFYRGLIPQLIKTAPSSAITFLIYETVIKFLNKAAPSIAAPVQQPEASVNSKTNQLRAE